MASNIESCYEILYTRIHKCNYLFYMRFKFGDALDLNVSVNLIPYVQQLKSDGLIVGISIEPYGAVIRNPCSTYDIIRIRLMWTLKFHFFLLRWLVFYSSCCFFFFIKLFRY